MKSRRYAVVVPADCSQPIKLVEMGSEAPLRLLYREIGCSRVDVVRLDGWEKVPDLDMWLDDDGRLVQDPVPNVRATGVALAVRGTELDDVYVGTCVFALSDQEGDTTGMTPSQATTVCKTADVMGARIDAYQGMRRLIEQEKRLWSEVGAVYNSDADRPAIEAAIAELEWLPVTGGHIVGPLSPISTLERAAREFDISRVTTYALGPGLPYPDGPETATYQLLGLEGAFLNPAGRVRIYVLDIGTALVPLAVDFRRPGGGQA